MTNVTYNMAYAEVLEILKYLPESELRKIPQDEIKFLENNMDKNYKFAIDPEKALEEQNISRKANAILVVYFKKYCFIVIFSSSVISKMALESSMNWQQPNFCEKA